MKKIYLFILFSFTLLSLKSEIKYDINKYGVMSVFFTCYDTDSLTSSLFKDDWNNAIEIALNNKKVKQIQFKNRNGDIIAWSDKKNYLSLEKELNKILYETVFVRTDSIIGRKTVYSDDKPQYKIDTYKNGKLISTYSSDWDGGHVEPKYSTHKIYDDTYETKTYVSYNKKRPLQVENIYYYEEKLIDRKDLTILKEIYIIIK